MKLAWYVRRIARMDATEIAGRARDAALKWRWRLRQVRDAEVDRLAVPRDVPTFATSLPAAARDRVPHEARERLIAGADALLGGTWRVFDCTRSDMAPTPDWFFDPKTGRRAPDRTYAFDVNHRHEHEVGNIKYLWEPSRHQHLTLLAAAYYLSGDARYAAAVETQLTSWWRENPFLSGIHWTSAIEVGVRLIAWVWIRRLLHDWDGARGLFEDNPLFLRQLHHHQDYLFRLSSHGSSANNHLIAEAAGQFAAACAFPWLRPSSKWRAWAAATLNREAVKQTFPCGLNRELASEYHGFVLELMLAAAVEGEAAGHGLDPALWATLQRMTDALAAVVDRDIHPPRQGDADDALGLLLDGAEGFDRWRSLLNSGDAWFGRLPWWPDPGAADVRAALWTALTNPPDLEGQRPAERPSLFPDAGMALLRDTEARDDEIWCRCDHGPHGYLSIAAHAHADALSVELRYGGVELLTDPGTYCYHGDPAWRSYFRSTIGHNTLELAHRDQSIAGGPFMWTHQTKARLLDAGGLDEGDVARWRAAHDGYATLDRPFEHEREVSLDRVRRCLTIVDSVSGDGTQDCRLAFHLGPDIDCRLDRNVARLAWSAEGRTHAAILMLPPELEWSCIKGQSDPPLGWYSPGFDRKQPAFTLLGAGAIGARDKLVSELRLGPGADEAARLTAHAEADG